MHRMNDAGLDPEPQAHQGADGKKGLHARRTLDCDVSAGKTRDIETKETPADQQTDAHEHKLHDAAQPVRTLTFAQT